MKGPGRRAASALLLALIHRTSQNLTSSAKDRGRQPRGAMAMVKEGDGGETGGKGKRGRRERRGRDRGRSQERGEVGGGWGGGEAGGGGGEGGVGGRGPGEKMGEGEKEEGRGRWGVVAGLLSKEREGEDGGTRRRGEKERGWGGGSVCFLLPRGCSFISSLNLRFLASSPHARGPRGCRVFAGPKKVAHRCPRHPVR